MLGVRGSVPTTGEDFQEFGGATTCVRVLAGDQEIFFDAGSGIVGIQPEANTNVTILMTHPHVDHLIGLPFFGGMSQKNRTIVFFLKKRNGMGLKQVMRCLYTPPLWPIGIADYPANVHFQDLLWDDFLLGDVHIRTMEGNHPGGVTVYRLDYQGKSVVFATDYEHTDKKDAELISFAKDCSLLIYDGQYTQEEYEKCSGFGHSTPQMGIRIAKEANAKRLLITHHAPEHTDAVLHAMEEEAGQQWEGAAFAKCGQKIVIS